MEKNSTTVNCLFGRLCENLLSVTSFHQYYQYFANISNIIFRCSFSPPKRNRPYHGFRRH